MKRSIILRSVLFGSMIMLRVLPSPAQAGAVDPAFDPGSGFNDEARRVTLQPDGKVLVVGTFTSFDGVTRNRIARLNVDGSLDAAYATGAGFNAGPVRDLALASDGKLYACGDFAAYNGTTRNGLTRLTATGGMDGTFNAGSGMGIGGLDALALLPNGQLYAGGSFDTFNGAAEPDLVRLNTTGTRDPIFDTGLGFDYQPQFPGGGVRDIAIDQAGWLIMVGNFSFYDGLSPFVGTICRGIARLDPFGNFDPDFAHGTDYYGGVDGFDGGAARVMLQPDGRILAGGGFTLYNGIARNGIVRLLSDGSLDPSFDPGSGFDAAVNAMALQPDGRILVGGAFTSFNGIPCERIARLNADGTLDTSFQPIGGFDGPVSDLFLQPDGRLLACGSFAHFGAAERAGIARLYTTDAVCIPSQLTTTADPVVSCGAVGLMLDGSSTISASEVPGANKYQFHFTNIPGQPAYARNIAWPTRSFTLTQWYTSPLKPGRIYNVTVRASFDNGATWCDWGPSCTVQVGWSPFAPGMVRDMEEAALDAPELLVYPNPTNGDQVRIALHGADPTLTTATLNLVDPLGKRVMTATLPLQDGALNNVLSLNGELPTGLYLLTITAGEQVFNERLTITR